MDSNNTTMIQMDSSNNSGCSASNTIATTATAATTTATPTIITSGEERLSVALACITKPPHVEADFFRTLGVCYRAEFIGYVPIHIAIGPLLGKTKSELAHYAMSKVLKSAGQIRWDFHWNTLSDELKRTVAKEVHVSAPHEQSVIVSIKATNVCLINATSGDVCRDLPLSGISFIYHGTKNKSNFLALIAKEHCKPDIKRNLFVFKTPNTMEMLYAIKQCFELSQHTRENVSSGQLIVGQTSTSSSSSASTLSSNNMMEHQSTSSTASSSTSSASTSIRATSATPSTSSSITSSSSVTIALQDNCVETCNDVVDSGDDKMDISINQPNGTTTKSNNNNQNNSNNNNVANNQSKSKSNNLIASMFSKSQSSSPSPIIQYSARDCIHYLPDCDIEHESWYHGTITVEKSEQLIKKDGEFLVRQSNSVGGDNDGDRDGSGGGSRGGGKDSTQLLQYYTLSGMKNGKHHHLLLYNNRDGFLIKTEMIFSSISHLINYYHYTKLPLVVRKMTSTSSTSTSMLSNDGGDGSTHQGDHDDGCGIRLEAPIICTGGGKKKQKNTFKYDIVMK